MVCYSQLGWWVKGNGLNAALLSKPTPILCLLDLSKDYG
jgi:hypothetical protein